MCLLLPPTSRYVYGDAKGGLHYLSLSLSFSPALFLACAVLLYGSFRRHKNEIAVKPSRRDANKLELRLYEGEFFARPTRDSRPHGHTPAMLAHVCSRRPISLVNHARASRYVFFRLRETVISWSQVVISKLRLKFEGVLCSLLLLCFFSLTVLSARQSSPCTFVPHVQN